MLKKFSVRLNEHEHAAVTASAKRNNISVAQQIRNSILAVSISETVPAADLQAIVDNKDEPQEKLAA